MTELIASKLNEWTISIELENRSAKFGL